MIDNSVFYMKPFGIINNKEKRLASLKEAHSKKPVYWEVNKKKKNQTQKTNPKQTQNNQKIQNNKKMS